MRPPSPGRPDAPELETAPTMTTVRTRRRRAFLLGAASMLLVWAGTVAAWAFLDGDRSDGLVVSGAEHQHVVVGGASGLTISGSLTVPLRPGTGQRLDLVLDNTTGSPLAVSDLEVRIAGLTAPNMQPGLDCTIDDFAIEQSTFSVELAPDESSSLTGAGAVEDELPLVSMRDTDVDQAGCIGASLALEYSAVGTST